MYLEFGGFSDVNQGQLRRAAEQDLTKHWQGLCKTPGPALFLMKGIYQRLALYRDLPIRSIDGQLDGASVTDRCQHLLTSLFKVNPMPEEITV